MSQLILLDVLTRDNRSVGASPVSTGFDVDDIASPIRNNGTSSYFTARQITGSRSSGNSQQNTLINYTVDDDLATIDAMSYTLVALTVTKMGSKVFSTPETMVFNTKRIMEAIVPVSALGGARFYYHEDGNPLPVFYEVAEDPATIVAAGVITTGVNGSGTSRFLARWVTPTTLGDSSFYQDISGAMGLNTLTPSAALTIKTLGNNDTTIGFNILNSGSGEMFSIRDDGRMVVGYPQSGLGASFGHTLASSTLGATDMALHVGNNGLSSSMLVILNNGSFSIGKLSSATSYFSGDGVSNFVIDGDGADQRFGINEPSPLHPLHVVTNADEAITAKIENTSNQGFAAAALELENNLGNQGGLMVPGEYYGFGWFDNTAIIGDLCVYAEQDIVFLSNAIGGLPTASSEKARITTLGDFALGILVPEARLHVFGVNADGVNQRLEPYTDVVEETTGGFVSTSGAVTTTIQSISIPLNSGMIIESRITARKTAGVGAGVVGDVNGYIRTLKVKNVGGVVTAGITEATYTDEDIATLDVSFAVSGTDILLQVTGVVNDDVDWNVITKTYPITQ